MCGSPRTNSLQNEHPFCFLEHAMHVCTLAMHTVSAIKNCGRTWADDDIFIMQTLADTENMNLVYVM